MAFHIIQKAGFSHEAAKLQIVVLGIASGAVPFDMVLAPAAVRYRTAEADWKTTTAVLLYSSGTTGFPKAVQISHYALVANVEQMK